MKRRSNIGTGVNIGYFLGGAAALAAASFVTYLIFFDNPKGGLIH